MSAGTGGGFSKAVGSGQSNPLFGQDSYIEVAVVFRRTRIFTIAPADVLKKFGRIEEQLPAEAEGIPTPDGRNWFVLAPTAERRGNVWTVAEEWMLSPPGQKWNADVFNFIVS